MTVEKDVFKYYYYITFIVNGYHRYHSFTCTPCTASARGMSHTCLCLPSRSWYSFTDLGGMDS